VTSLLLRLADLEVFGAARAPRRAAGIRLIWMERAIDGTFHFVTLVPLKG
jgi:hypothetical protein